MWKDSLDSDETVSILASQRCQQEVPVRVRFGQRAVNGCQRRRHGDWVSVAAIITGQEVVPLKNETLESCWSASSFRTSHVRDLPVIA